MPHGLCVALRCGCREKNAIHGPPPKANKALATSAPRSSRALQVAPSRRERWPLSGGVQKRQATRALFFVSVGVFFFAPPPRRGGWYYKIVRKSKKIKVPKAHLMGSGLLALSQL